MMRFSSLIKMMLPVLVVMVAGCAKKEPDPVVAACPEKTVSMVQGNQHFLDTVKVGETPAKRLRQMQNMRRKATLVKAGEASLEVRFYQTGMPRCPWVMAAESLTPVIIKDGVIAGYGGDAVKDKTAHGWVLKEAVWPWQRYSFGYLPLN